MENNALATLSEDLLSNDIMAKPSDAREYLHSHNRYIPVSSDNYFVWDIGEADIDALPDMIDKGDRVVSKAVMDVIMSWDPYGVIFVPVKLKSNDSLSDSRYIMAVNNIIDVMDEENSFVFTRDNSRYNLPPDIVVNELYISETKYAQICESKKHIFRVKGADGTIFFSAQMANTVWDVAVSEGLQGMVMQPFDFNEEAPGF
uniref:imm11 family protein n=1 Tax=Thaumasiovibrio occultus TaxID=1891184 RepID=UPI000B3552C9|nr:DUF1629 domain-containing protein [Thaumasiovibrio occultus]